jgi:hypothetical protein
MSPIDLPLRYSQSRCPDCPRKWVNRSRNQIQLHFHHHPNPERRCPNPNPIPSRHKRPRESSWQLILQPLGSSVSKMQMSQPRSAPEWMRPPSEVRKWLVLAIDSRPYGIGKHFSATVLRRPQPKGEPNVTGAHEAAPPRAVAAEERLCWSPLPSYRIA